MQLETEVTSPRPMPLPTGEGVRHAAFGPHHALAVSDSGKVFGMGWNLKGELGEKVQIGSAEVSFADAWPCA
mgnify:CR=1 FL=1